MDSIAQALARVRAEIASYARRYGRDPAEIRLLAVSKTKPAAALREAAAAGQTRFGENYVQEALQKIEALADLNLEWHFIGPLQSNKTRPVAEHFAWLHSLDQLKHARRLSAQRPSHLLPLKVCIQVDISREVQKAGIDLAELPAFATAISELPGLELRGLMALPAWSEDLESRRRPFRALREAYLDLQNRGFALDTLSMGMSGDLEAAIAEGTTIVRVGTAIFGARG